MFSPDQMDYMRSLDKIPASGWWRAEVEEVANNLGETVNAGCDQDAVTRVAAQIDRLFALAAAPDPRDAPPAQVEVVLAATGIVTASPVAAAPEALIEAGRRLIADRKQNDHCTADPIYTVQREDRVYHVVAGEGDGFVWVVEGELCSDDLSARIERRYRREWPIPERFERIEYRTRWEFVDAYLSYESAKARVELENRKHSGRYRTYVESGCRNHEWKALQAYLLALAAAQAADPQPYDQGERAHVAQVASGAGLPLGGAE